VRWSIPIRFEPPEGWVYQSFCFALDLTDDQRASVNRQFGARRYARNWAVATMKADLSDYLATGAETPPPSLARLRKRWNEEKDSICVNAVTGEPWWREVSKEAFSDGINGAVDGYWRWQKSGAGTLAGHRVGFPRFKKKGRDTDRCTFTTGAMRVEPDHRHLTLPRIGLVRTHENTRRIERLIRDGRARVLSITLRRRGTRIMASVKVVVLRPQQPGVTRPDSVVGVDVGVRRLATVASPKAVIARVENPKALPCALGDLRRLQRQRARRTPGSRRYRETTTRISGLHARVADVRSNRHPPPHHPPGQDPRHGGGGSPGCGRDAAPERSPRGPRPSAGPL
jgi:putative transposase